MPMYFQKTENALKRAREFIEVDKKESGLECLNDVIHSKKHRQTWTTTHEHIMKLFVELCVDLQRSAFAKDGLYQYRNICREVSLHSFEVVVKHFLKLASDRADAAREESEQAVLHEVEDLDVIMTPENLLLSTVSGEGVKERSDRVLLAPWVKFLWESYRNMLELLKNNNTIERLYAEVAKEAFKFCLKYQRRTEFRKLCEILKNHLTQAQKYQSQSHSLRFENPETIQYLVDVRFEQLECSISIDLWQEAFKAIEEIHNLLELSGKAPRPGLLDNYYSRQAKVYWMANNRLFHAAALHKLFVLWKEQKKSVSQEELQRIASRVLLATLCVPIKPTPSDVDRFLEVDQANREKARRLAALLRMTSLPTRASLLRDVGRHSVLQHTPPELQLLYTCLEVEFNPLQLCRKVSPVLDGLADDEILSPYVEPTREVLLVRLIKEVSQVYETVKLDWLTNLVPFTTSTHLETVVIETAHSNGIQVHIDHRTNCLRFGSDMSFSYKNESPEGPYVQPMPSEALCCQLQMFSAALQQAVQIITTKESEREQAETMRELSQSYLDHARVEHRNVLARKQLIEARKEYIESQSRAKEHKENAEKRQKEEQERKAELERLEREAEERAESKKKKEIAERRRIEREQRIESLKKTPIGIRALETITQEELDKMDVDFIMAKQLKQMEKELREKDTKLRTQEKKIDHWERAKKLVEIPLLEKHYQQQIVEDKAFHEQQEEERVSTEVRERKEMDENRERMGRMESNRREFLNVVRKERQEAHMVKLKEFEAMVEVARQERLERRREERKAKRKAEAAALKKDEEEKELRARQEAQKARQEEERRQRQEVDDAQMMTQRRRDEEIEAKLRRREEEAQRDRQQPMGGEERDWRSDQQQQQQQGGWRKEEPERPPPQRWRDTEEKGREDSGEYPSLRAGAYRPPIRREAEGGGWRAREEEREKGPEGEEDGESPRRPPQGILKGERGRGEREAERERGVSWEDERKPQPPSVQEPEGERGRGGREEEGRGWRREERDSSPRMYRRERDGEREEWRGRGDEERGGTERGYGGPRREREPERRGWGREAGEGDGGGWRRGGEGRDADRGGWRGREGESDRGGWRGRDGESERGGVWRGGREGDSDRERGGWRGREGDSESGGGGWRGRDGESERGGGGWRGRGDSERGGGGWRGGREGREGDSERGGWRGREGESERGGGWRGREGESERGGGWRGREGESERGGGWKGREGDQDRSSGGGWRGGGRREGGYDRDRACWRGGREDSDQGGGAWHTDRPGGGGSWKDRDQGPAPRRYEGDPDERGPPRRDDDKPRRRDEGGERRGDEGWEVVGRKR